MSKGEKNRRKLSARTLHLRISRSEVIMSTPKRQAKIKHILCPTDLSLKSQMALGYAARLAESLNASLTACHCAPARWFSSENHLPPEEMAEVKTAILERIERNSDQANCLQRRVSIVENSFDPARDILNLAAETDVDLIVMKARAGGLSAFRFGSIVERVVSRAKCPVLLIPSRFLVDRDQFPSDLGIRRILFDYDFSAATDTLFGVANTLARDFAAELHLLTVLASPISGTELAAVRGSRTAMQTAIRGKLNEVLQSEGKSIMTVPTAVEWGNHAEAVLRYAGAHQIDLICTTLPPPHFYVETLYRAYLGNLLKSSRCPILVEQTF